MDVKKECRHNKIHNIISTSFSLFLRLFCPQLNKLRQKGEKVLFTPPVQESSVLKFNGRGRGRGVGFPVLGWADRQNINNYWPNWRLGRESHPHIHNHPFQTPNLLNPSAQTTDEPPCPTPKNTHWGMAGGGVVTHLHVHRIFRSAPPPNTSSGWVGVCVRRQINL